MDYNFTAKNIPGSHNKEADSFSRHPVNIPDESVETHSEICTYKVYSERDLFKTLTSMNIAGDHHNRMIHRFIEL